MLEATGTAIFGDVVGREPSLPVVRWSCWLVLVSTYRAVAMVHRPLDLAGVPRVWPQVNRK